MGERSLQALRRQRSLLANKREKQKQEDIRQSREAESKRRYEEGRALSEQRQRSLQSKAAKQEERLQKREALSDRERNIKEFERRIESGQAQNEGLIDLVTSTSRAKTPQEKKQAISQFNSMGKMQDIQDVKFNPDGSISLIHGAANQFTIPEERSTAIFNIARRRRDKQQQAEEFAFRSKGRVLEKGEKPEKGEKVRKFRGFKIAVPEEPVKREPMSNFEVQRLFGAARREGIDTSKFMEKDIMGKNTISDSGYEWLSDYEEARKQFPKLSPRNRISKMYERLDKEAVVDTPNKTDDEFGSEADKPVIVSTPQDAINLPEGTWVKRPDGKVFQIKRKQVKQTAERKRKGLNSG